VPAPHFRVKKLPETPPLDFGPLQLSRQYKALADGSVEATFKLKIDKQQLSPADVAAIKAGYAALAREENDSVEFEHDAEHLLQTNQPQQAIQLLRKLSQAEPKTALPLLLYALKLSALGFGEQAREAGRAATRLEPKSGVAWRTLGTLLQRDKYGRWLEPGFDREGAMFSKMALATMLEHDAKGQRYTDAASVTRAIEIYDGIGEAELASYDGGDYQFNALYALVNLGRYDELKLRLAKLKATDVPAALGIAVEAAEAGGAAGIALADRKDLRAEARSEALAAAAGFLYMSRRYAEASLLFSEAAKGSKEAAKYSTLARTLGNAARIDPAQLKQDSPEAMVRKLQVLALASEEVPKSGPAVALLSSRAEEGLLSRLWVSSGKTPIRAPRAVLADTGAAMLKSSLEGSDTLGYRVHTTISGIDERVSTTDFYVVKEGAAYLLRATGRSAALGCEALYQLQRHNAKAAKQWLSWASEGLEAEEGNDPLRAQPFARLWNDGKGNAELAAAALCAEGKAGAEARQLLLKHRALSGADSAAIEQAIAQSAGWDKSYETQLNSAEKLLSLFPSSRTARELQLGALWSLKRFDVFEREAREAAEERKSNLAARAELLKRAAAAQKQQGKFVEARRSLQQLLDQNQIRERGGVYNDAAWIGLFIEPRPQDMLEQALQAVQATGSDPPVLHTLACVYLDRGQIADAQRSFDQLLRLDPEPELADSTRYLLGGLAEAYGMPDVARTVYASVKAPENASRTSVYALSQRKLQALNRTGAR
jgi:hypothetical protein